MAAMFTYAKGHEDGFDWFYPPWMMVGVHRHRNVLLLNCDGLHLHNPDPSIVTAKFADDNKTCTGERIVTITSHSRGFGCIEARQGHLAKAVLNVCVYPHRVVKVNFFRVKDKSGKVPNFNSSMVNGLTRQINHLHKHQTNMSFESHLVHNEVHIDLDFSTTNQSPSQIKHIWDVLKAKCRQLDNSPSHYHVFWVKVWGRKDKKCKGKMVRDVIGTASDIGGHLCVMEDMHDPHKQGLLLAHELAHCLKAHHDEKRESALMYPRLTGGRKFYRHAVEEMRGRLRH